VALQLLSNAFIICHVAVDALSVISSSLSWAVDILSACTVFGVCFVGGVIVVAFDIAWLFSVVVGDLCHSGIVAVGSWVIFACFLAILACAFCSCGVAHVGGHPGAKVCLYR